MQNYMTSFISCGSMRRQLVSCSKNKTDQMVCLENPADRAKRELDRNLFSYSVDVFSMF